MLHFWLRIERIATHSAIHDGPCCAEVGKVRLIPGQAASSKRRRNYSTRTCSFFRRRSEPRLTRRRLELPEHIGDRACACKHTIVNGVPHSATVCMAVVWRTGVPLRIWSAEAAPQSDVTSASGWLHLPRIIVLSV